VLAWLDNERVTRWIAIVLAPFIVFCYLKGFYFMFGEFGNGLSTPVSLLVILAAGGGALRSIRAQVNRERDELAIREEARRLDPSRWYDRSNQAEAAAVVAAARRAE
jgi:hypothetical protein